LGQSRCNFEEGVWENWWNCEDDIWGRVGGNIEDGVWGRVSGIVKTVCGQSLWKYEDGI